MTTLPPPGEMYSALSQRDTSYEGVFIVGVRTTGVFCRPGCPARTPKLENIEFFATTAEALGHGYRACLRCRPLEEAGATPQWVTELLVRVEADPTLRWRDQDIRAAGVDPARARRWFQRNHGMTFHAYARARRLGRALGRIQEGDDATGIAFESGFESLSGFREAFARLFKTTPGASESKETIRVTRIASPLGPLLVGVDESHLLLLEFTDRRMLETQIKRLAQRTGAAYIPGETALTGQVATELREYFQGERTEFTVPTRAPGTDFQQQVWAALSEIPYGELRSYADVAEAVGRPNAVRAVGTANGCNRIAIVIPCHRVVRSDGELGGYGGQLWRKRALLDIESAQTHF